MSCFGVQGCHESIHLVNKESVMPCETLTFFSKTAISSLEFSIHVFNKLSFLFWEHFDKTIHT